MTDADAVRDALVGDARAPKDDPKLYGAGILDGGRGRVARLLGPLRAARGSRSSALAWLVAAAHPQARRRRSRATPGAVVGRAASRASASCPFAPLLGPRRALRGRAARRCVELAMRPLGEWDLVALRRRACTAGCSSRARCPSIALTALGFASRRAPAVHRRHRARHGGAPRADGVVGRRGLRRRARCWRALWAVVNALVCLWIARIALDAKRPPETCRPSTRPPPRAIAVL